MSKRKVVEVCQNIWLLDVSVHINLLNLSSCVELPWDQPSESCQEYSDWLQKKTYLTPWKKIDSLPLGKQKFKWKGTTNIPWTYQNFILEEGMVALWVVSWSWVVFGHYKHDGPKLPFESAGDMSSRRVKG